MAWRARTLVDDIEKATTRISDLVGAIKEYAYRDQSPLQIGGRALAASSGR